MKLSLFSIIPRKPSKHNPIYRSITSPFTLLRSLSETSGDSPVPVSPTHNPHQQLRMSSPPPLPQLLNRWWCRQTGQIGWTILGQPLQEKGLDTITQIELGNFRLIRCPGGHVGGTINLCPPTDVGPTWWCKQHFLSGMDAPMYASHTVLLVWKPGVNLLPSQNMVI